ncbi:MAG: RNA polymerase sigma factor SigZ [Lacibacter sp.]
MEGKSVYTNCDVPAVWQEHKDALLNYIRKRVKDEALAEDLLQETLLKLYHFCMNRSGVSNIRSWLFQIAHNNIVDHYRKVKTYTSGEQLEEVAAEDENLAFRDALNYILPMLSFLPEHYAEPLRMADVEGMKQAAIAEKLGLSLTATKSRIQRARQLLKAEFVTCCHFETDSQGNIISFSVKDSCKPLQQIRKKISR